MASRANDPHKEACTAADAARIDTAAATRRPPPMSPSPRAIAVACALIERDGRLLVARRPAHKHAGLKWEFPGGKIEADELPEAALIREIREELGCAVEIVSGLPRSVHAYEAVTVELVPDLCRLVPASPEPQPAEHVEIRWIPPRDLAAIDLAAADRPVAKAYLERPHAGA